MSDITEILEVKPKAEPEVKKGGLISKEFFDFTLNAIYDYPSTLQNEHLVKNIKLKSDTHVPLYAINMKPDNSLPVNAIISGDFSLNSYEKLIAHKSGIIPWQGNATYTNLLQKCLEKEAYNVLLFVNHRTDSKITVKDDLAKALKNRFTEYVNSPYDVRIFREGRSNAKSYPDMIANSKYFCSWAKGRTRKLNATDPVIYYLTNFYYMAKLTEAHGGSIVEPMYSVMIRKEHVGFVRACIMTNTPIPVELLELWIDQKLDKVDSEYKIRPTFVKLIKTPMKTMGIKIVVHENLYDTMYTRPTMPKFKTLVERAEWINDLSKRLLLSECQLQGIKSIVPPAPKAQVVTVELNASDIKERMEEFERITAELLA